jgi:hypothetical protein
MTQSRGPSDPGDLPVPPTGKPGLPSGPPTSGVPGPKPERLTLTGTVEAGVESGCLLLRGYLLLGGPRDLLTSGRTVTVTGRTEPGMVTYCQQGTPFLVESAELA